MSIENKMLNLEVGFNQLEFDLNIELTQTEIVETCIFETCNNTVTGDIGITGLRCMKHSLSTYLCDNKGKKYIINVGSIEKL